MFCSKCGKQVEGNAKFCEECGAKVAQAISSESKNSNKTRNIVLGVILGIIVVCVGIAAILAASHSGGTSDTSTDWLTYSNSNSDCGFVMSYPSEWTKQEEWMGTVVVFLSPKDGTSDAGQENVNVVVEDLTANPMSLSEYWDLSLNQISKFITDCNVIESSGTTVAGKPASRVVFTGQQGQYQLKYMQICTIRNNSAYTITYTSEVAKYADYVDIVNQMVDSFEFSGEGEASDTSGSLQNLDVGQSAQNWAQKVTVISVDRYVRNGVNEGYVEITIYAEVENIGGGTLYADYHNFSFSDSEGNRYTTNITSYGGFPMMKGLYEGEKTGGNLLLTAPTSATGLKMAYNFGDSTNPALARWQLE